MRNRDDIEIEVTFIRHGQTPSNKEKRYISYTDEGLSLEGREEIVKNIEDSYYPGADMIFTSPMRRCLETAKLIYPNCKNIVIDELKEMNFGIFEGRNFIDLEDNADYRKWVDSGCMDKIPQGESMEEFTDRQVRAFEKILSCVRENIHKKVIESLSDCNKLRVSIICHGGSIMAIFSKYGAGGYFDNMIKNAQKKTLNINVNINSNRL